MKLKAFVVAGFFVSTGAIAGGGHSHGAGSHTHGGHGHSHDAEAAINEDQAKARSKEEIDRLILKKKLDTSWSKAEFVSAEKKAIKGKEEWLIVYKNATTEKKDLFVFLSASGKFVAANHTGK